MEKRQERKVLTTKRHKSIIIYRRINDQTKDITTGMTTMIDVEWMKKDISKNKSKRKGKKNKDDGEEVDEGTKEIRENQEKEAQEETNRDNQEGQAENRERVTNNTEMDLEGKGGGEKNEDAKDTNQDQDLDL